MACGRGETGQRARLVLMCRVLVMRRFVLFLVGLVAALAACSGGENPTDPRCEQAMEHSDLDWLQENVFTRSCSAFSSCHMGSAPEAGELNLEAGMLEENVIDVESELSPGMDIVEPGVSDESYMMVILGQFGTDDPRIDPEKGTMPYNNELLCVEKRDAIARWIDSLEPSAVLGDHPQ